jgi:serpin B
MKAVLLTLGLFLATSAIAVDSTAPSATAINSFGLDLLRKAGKPDTNALFSPYSIEIALAMTYAGADGATRNEMTRTLHFDTNEIAMHRSFRLLQSQMNGVMQRSGQLVEGLKKHGFANPGDPITLTVANRLFGQQGYVFREPFLSCLKNYYEAPLVQADFRKNAAGATKLINDWAGAQTKNRIRNVIPDGALNGDIRLVLVNAIYLKAPWEMPFYEGSTKPLPFRVGGGLITNVPTMQIQTQLGYSQYRGFRAVTIPYKGGEIQFLILLPDADNGLAELESRLTQLDKCASLPIREVKLCLPKFKLEPATISLAKELKLLGMKSAFGAEADFGRMAEGDLFITEIFHKTFLALDEKGTEAAAVTFADVGTGIPPKPPKPVEVKVDHAFIFAIQHRASGACLFLGHVVNPQ